MSLMSYSNFLISLALSLSVSLVACTPERDPFFSAPLNARCIGSTDGRPFLEVHYNRHRAVVGVDRNIPVQCEVITFGCDADQVVVLSVEGQPGPDRACTGNIIISDPSYLESLD